MPAETHSHREVSAVEVKRVVFEHAAEVLDVDLELVTEDTALPEDSLAILDLVQLSEEELADRTVGLELDDEVTECETVGDVVGFVAQRVGVPVD